MDSPNTKQNERQFLKLARWFYLPMGLGSTGLILFLDGEKVLLSYFSGLYLLYELLFACIFTAVVVISWQLMAERFTVARDFEDTVRGMIKGFSPVTCFELALLSSMSEELLFRGLLQPIIGLVPCSIIFGAIHFPREKALIIWPIWAAVVGLCLGTGKIYFQGLVFPILAHFLINFIHLRKYARIASLGFSV